MAFTIMMPDRSGEWPVSWGGVTTCNYSILTLSVGKLISKAGFFGIFLVGDSTLGYLKRQWRKEMGVVFLN